VFEDVDEEIGPWDDLPPDEGAREALAVLKGTGPDNDRGEAAIFIGAVLELYDEDDPLDDYIPAELANELRGALWTLYDDKGQSELLRRRCLEAAVRWPNDRVDPAIRAALDTPGDWRVTGLFCAGFVEGYEDEVRDAIAKGSHEERIEAWRAASNLELHDLAPTAVQLANDTKANREERYEAIAALAWLGESAEAGRTLEQLVASGDEEISEVAEEALSLRADAEAGVWDVDFEEDDDGEGGFGEE
jgi:hypothetical protein